MEIKDPSEALQNSDMNSRKKSQKIYCLNSRGTPYNNIWHHSRTLPCWIDYTKHI